MVIYGNWYISCLPAAKKTSPTARACCLLCSAVRINLVCWVHISVSVCISLCFHEFRHCSGPVLQETGTGTCMHQVVVDRALVLASSTLAMFVICHFGHVIGTRLFVWLLNKAPWWLFSRSRFITVVSCPSLNSHHGADISFAATVPSEPPTLTAAEPSRQGRLYNFEGLRQICSSQGLSN
jgi:hypothetical protein